MNIGIALLVFFGAMMIAIAALGLVRLPDFYLRTAATTKAITLGVALMLIGVAFFFMETTVSARVGAIILFLLLTSPVGAHMIGRAAYMKGVPLWDRTVADQWQGRIPAATPAKTRRPSAITSAKPEKARPVRKLSPKKRPARRKGKKNSRR